MNAPHWSDRWANAADLAARLDRCVDRAPIVAWAAAELRGPPLDYVKGALAEYANDLRDQAKLVAERYGAYDDAEALTDAADALDELAMPARAKVARAVSYFVGAPYTPETYERLRDVVTVETDGAVIPAPLGVSSVIAGVAVTEHQLPGSVYAPTKLVTLGDCPPTVDPCDGCDGVGCSRCTDDDGCPL